MNFSKVDLSGMVNPSSPAQFCTVARSGENGESSGGEDEALLGSRVFSVKGIGGTNGPRPEQYFSPIFSTAWPIVLLRDLGIFCFGNLCAQQCCPMLIKSFLRGHIILWNYCNAN
jgi:hypothetical protein